MPTLRTRSPHDAETHRPLGSSITARIIDYILYILIGLTIGGLVWFYGSHASPGEHADFRWLEFMCVTPITFGYPAKSYQRYWGRWRFWCLFAFLLVVHVSAYVFILRRVEHFGLIWFPVLNFLEWLVIYPTLDWSGKVS